MRLYHADLLALLESVTKLPYDYQGELLQDGRIQITRPGVYALLRLQPGHWVEF